MINNAAGDVLTKLVSEALFARNATWD